MIAVYNDFEQINKTKFKDLIKRGFDRKLTKGYFKETQPKKIYIWKSNGEYVGAAVVLKEKFNYLDKFVVAEEHQKKGIGKKLWKRLIKDNKKIFWRAQINNPINPWYFKNSTGHHKSGKWTVFWVGLKNNDINYAIEYALSKKETLEPLG